MIERRLDTAFDLRVAIRATNQGLVLARGWLIERARVRRLMSEIDALECEVEELRQELEHQRAETWEAMSDAQRDAAIKGACA
jgi:outer membrane murein-binding lipoprotein Lpp